MKLLILVFIIFFVTGCTQVESSVEEKDVDYIFTIDKASQNIYQQTIEQLLDELYWKYNKDTISYAEEVIVNKNNKLFPELSKACSDIDTDIQKFGGKSAIAASINLLHINNDFAGTAKFYFVNDELVGGYYSPQYDKSLIISLKQRNIFARNVEFNKYEDKDLSRTFSEAESDISVNGFTSMGKNNREQVLIASIDEKNVVIYKYNADKFIVDKKLNFSNNLIPLSVIFMENTEGMHLAVLLGESIYIENSEQQSAKIISKKIVFYDQFYNKFKLELDLNYPNYTTLMFDEESLVVAASNTLNYYNYSKNNWNKGRQVTLEHDISFITKVDPDNSGDLKYVITDGLDLYLYRKKNKSFNLLWRTHFGRRSYNAPIYCADLNGDGVKEIYIGDQSSTTIRYILTEHGLISNNVDILFDERIFAGDFNSDGKDDFIKVTNSETNEQKIYIAN